LTRRKRARDQPRLTLRRTYKGLPIVKVLVNGNPLESDVPAVVLDGRTLLPVRAVSEALGAQIHWEGALSTVYITTQPGATPAITAQASAALQAIKQKDWNGLAMLAHPTQGVRFSPYGHVKTGASGDRIRTTQQLQAGFTDQAVYNWGSYDGSGNPIDLTFADYYAQFVYNHDFTQAPVIVYNQIAGQGNTMINLHEVYPQGQFVEYHFPGFDPQYEGMDWQSLRLVFEESAGNWYLVGIIHDQWTI
jgi:hypothetical protein